VWTEAALTGPRRAFSRTSRPASLKSDAFPLKVAPRVFALDGGGKLVADAPAGTGSDAYDYPLRGPAVEHEFTRDSWEPLKPGWEKATLAYTTPALPAISSAMGRVRPTCGWWPAARMPMCRSRSPKCAPMGRKSMSSAAGCASDRAQDPARSTPLRPWPLDKPETMQAMVPGQPALARIEIQKFAHVFRARASACGSTRPASLAATCCPQSVPTRLDVVHDAAHPSRLVLGEAPASAVVGAIPVARPACGSVVHQPCRPDPLAAGITPLGLPVSEGAN
jgi:hypothetical protein